MSKTLFWYIFLNLLKIFLLTTGGLAGIMSFAGLLRPLTENGLDMGQVNRMLLYLMPAMCTYSLPVAALFATTMVYGRFSSDNELVAMRAGGISYLSPRRFSIALPAVVLGLIVAMISLLMLCFIVPMFSLKVEEVIYSNIAKVITNKIAKEHLVDFSSGGLGNSINIFAQQARLLPPDPNHPENQGVELIGAAFMTYDTPDPNDTSLQVPNQIWMARKADVTIQPNAGSSAFGDAQLSVVLDQGVRFPRTLQAGTPEAGVAETSFGPRDIASPIKESVKFMDVTRLRELLGNPAESQKITTVTSEFAKDEQQAEFYSMIVGALNGKPKGTYNFSDDPDTHDQFSIGGSNLQAFVYRSELIVNSTSAPPTTQATPEPNDLRPVWLEQRSGSQVIFRANAQELHIRATSDLRSASDPEPNRMTVSVGLQNTEYVTAEGSSPRRSGSRWFSIPMPPSLVSLSDKSPEQFLLDVQLDSQARDYLRHEQIVVINSVTSELHGRASFALSCLVLVIVGCGLGVMFKSGNLLNAFAVSFVPALLCITLIVCGQQVATHVPTIGPGFRDPLPMSLWFIWVGNSLVLLTAICLTVRLQRR